MTKSSTMKRTAAAAKTQQDGRQPASARYTSVRALYSVYGKKHAAAVGGKGAPPGRAAKATDTMTPRTGAKKPKILQNFNVYARQPSLPIGRQVVQLARHWVHPPYPVKRSKEKKDRREGQRNYETFYVSIDDDSNANADNQDKPQLGGQKPPSVMKKIEAKLPQCRKNQKPLKEEYDQEFPEFSPEGEWNSLQLETSIEEMAKLIDEVKELRKQLLPIEDVLLPSPPQDGEEPKTAQDGEESKTAQDGEVSKPPKLMRSRTQTFSLTNCHPKLLEYVSRLPCIMDPMSPSSDSEEK